MKNIKKYIIGIAASICLTQCDVLDVDPTGWGRGERGKFSIR